jgi:hypothetical protein
MRKHCRICGSPLELKPFDKLSAEAAPLKITAFGMPAAKCSGDHAAPIDDEFMLWLIHELKAREASLPAGEEKGLLFKKYLCACGAELASNSENRQAFLLDLAYEGAPAFKVGLEMPVYKCTRCGKEQLRSHKAIQGRTAHGIARLNDAAGFPHSG